jgi:hypothetical protein
VYVGLASVQGKIVKIGMDIREKGALDCGFLHTTSDLSDSSVRIALAFLMRERHR